MGEMDDELRVAAKAGDVERVKRALEAEADPLIAASVALRWAARANQLETLLWLLPRAMADFDDSAALGWAADGGSLECLRVLIKSSNPKAMCSFALTRAAAGGHLSCALELIPVSDPKAGDSMALRSAAGAGETECVRALLPCSDLKAGWLDGQDALSLARRAGRSETAALIAGWEAALQERAELRERTPEARAAASGKGARL